jgi:hypothetical protein
MQELERVNEGRGCNRIGYTALEHEQRIGAGYLQLQLCLENPTDVCSVVCDAKEDIL